MGDPKIFLHELEILINQQVQYVMGMAARCPKEGCPEWDRLLSRYGVENIRHGGKTAELAPGARGAPPEEVQRVLEAIRDLAIPALSHIEYQYARPIGANRLLAGWVRRIRERLDSLPQLARRGSEPETRSVFENAWSQAAAI